MWLVDRLLDALEVEHTDVAVDEHSDVLLEAVAVDDVDEGARRRGREELGDVPSTWAPLQAVDNRRQHVDLFVSLRRQANFFRLLRDAVDEVGDDLRDETHRMSLRIQSARS